MTAALVALFACGVAQLFAARYLRQWSFVVGLVAMGLALALAVSQVDAVLNGQLVEESTTWVAALGLDVALRLDGFSLLMVLVITGVGAAVMAYGIVYFAPTVSAGRSAGLLVLFAGAMVALVLADNVGFLYVAWELTSITSFLLIGGNHQNPAARSAALHALLVTTAGGLALLAGLILLAQQAGTWTLSGILSEAPSGTVAGVGLALAAIGIVTKSAQYPFQAWLPAAMVAPTPVSAYLHSATMVTAGIYLAARLAPAFATTGAWRPAIMAVGIVTIFGGGLRALRQHDLKLLLAMGTVSQLGFMLVLVGAGIPEATAAGLTLLVAHALFKSTLFLVVGIIDHQAGTRDRRELVGFGKGWGAVKIVTVIAASAMAGLPPLLGFVSKEAAFQAFAHEGPWGAFVLTALVAGAALTVAYTVRFATTVLARPRDGAAVIPAPSWQFISPALGLAALTVVGGLVVAGTVGPLVEAATAGLYGGTREVDIALWHGFGLPLVLSGVALGIGALLAVWAARVDGLLGRFAPAGGGAEIYSAAVRGLGSLARLTTGVVQSGRLSTYVTVIVLTAVVVPAAALLSGGDWPGWPAMISAPAEAPVAALIVVAALATAAVRRRFAAVILLGAVGYGMGLVFVIYGAPDLALTQFAIETLTVVAFMLVLRFLPDEFEAPRPKSGGRLRLLTSVTVGVGVFVFAIIAAGARQVDPVGGELIERSLPEAGGRNVVNVILVDFRGLDTLGEISVLAVAGLGVMGLVRATRRPRVTEGSSR